MENTIKKEMDSSLWDTKICYTSGKGDAYEMSKQGSGSFDMVVAVGGDGTVNEVGRGLIGCSTPMGIIPTGSGNGLARFLKMPFKINRALQAITHHQVKAIDVIKLNEFYSFNVAGIGFDAFISHSFASRKNRGPLAYMQLVMQEFPNYKASSYKITVEGKTKEVNAFLISFANSSQWGNNVHIAPRAKIDDGLIDVCLIMEFPIITAPALLFSLLDQSIDKSKYDVIMKVPKVSVEHLTGMQGHVDGEPVNFGTNVNVEIMPLALNVAIPPAHLEQSQNLLTPFIDILPSMTGN